MGLSSKQVSGDGFDWTQNLLQSGGLEFSSKHPPLMMQQQQQQQQQQLTPLNCPRCDSTNTKFCYYNNYNRSQPRHFCKSCRRHWTKGGTLRNVPVGGGRKNKRLKTTNTTNNKKKNSINSIKKSESRNSNFITQLQQQQQHQQEQIKVSSGGDHQKNISEFLYQSLINPTSFTQPDFVNIQENSFVGSTDLSSSQIPSFQFTSLSNFENHRSSISSSFSTGCFQSSSNVFNQSGESDQSVENITNMNPTTMLMQMPGQVPNSTSNFMDSSINWSWEDINTFISTDFKQPWEDDQIKQ